MWRMIMAQKQSFSLGCLLALAALVGVAEGKSLKAKPVKKSPNPVVACDVRQWPQVLAAASRSKDIEIEFFETETAPQLTDKTAVIPKSFTDGQTCILQAIKNNRSGIDASMLKLQRYRTFINGKRILNYGYFYLGKTLKEPSAIQAVNGSSERRLLIKKVVWEELKHEGHTSAINAYDSQLLTWGRGFGARAGLLPPVLDRLFADPAIADVFLRYGVSWKKSFQVVNAKTGTIESGNSALRLIQADPKLLGVFVLIAEDARYAQKVADAQWVVVEQHAGAVPAYAHRWDDRWIQLVSHISHWWPTTGWKGADFSTSRGIQDILLTWGRKAAKQKNPFVVANADSILNLKRWGKGVGWEAIKSVSRTPMPYTRTQITNPANTEFRDVLCILAPGGASYYFFPKLPTLKIKGVIPKGEFGPEDSFYLLLDSLSMTERLESLSGLEEEELKEKLANYNRDYAERYGGRLRIALKTALLALPETQATLSDKPRITADADFAALSSADKKAITDFLDSNLR